jgi:hypothetical protein
MRRRPITRFRPCIERFEDKRLLSVTASTIAAAQLKVHSAGPAGRFAQTPGLATADSPTIRAARIAQAARIQRKSLVNKFLGFRITIPKMFPVNLIPPFQQVLVQSAKPVPGRVYNILYVVVKNGTARTFNASNGFLVRLNNSARSRTFPVLTGSQQWKPNRWIVFYVLTQKYYPVSFVGGGFQLDLGGASSTLVPGPSGIYLRLKYNPANFARKLNWIVAYGQGAQLGAGAKLGLPDTAINEIVAANTQRIDFGGHF